MDLLLACQQNNLAKVLELLPISDPTIDGNGPLRIAASSGYTDVLRAILADGRSDPAYLDSNALRLAARYGHGDCVFQLLTDGRADPTARGFEAMRMAADRGHADVLAHLISDPRCHDIVSLGGADTMLENAVDGGHLLATRLLIRDGRIHPTWDMLERAVQRDHVEIVRELLTDGRAGASCSALLAQASPRMIKELLDWYDPANDDWPISRIFKCITGPQALALLEDQRIYATEDALMDAALGGRADVVSVLLSNPRICLDDGNRTIAAAAARGHLDVVRLLCAAGIYPGSSALIAAARSGHLDVVRFLIEEGGVDPGTKDGEALKQAREWEHGPVVDYLSGFSSC